MSHVCTGRRARRTLSLMVAAAGLAAVAPQSASAAPSCTASEGVRTCAFPGGGVERWTVPADIDGPLTVTGRGGAGAETAGRFFGPSNPGGRPAQVTARFPLTSGTEVAVFVGGTGGRAQLDQVLPPTTVVDPAALLLNDPSNTSYPLLVAGGGGGAGRGVVLAQDDGALSEYASGGGGGDAGLPGGRAETGTPGQTRFNVGGGGGGTGAFSGVQGTGDVLQLRAAGLGGAAGIDTSANDPFSIRCNVLPGTRGADGSNSLGGPAAGGGGKGGDGFTGGGAGGTGGQAPDCQTTSGRLNIPAGHGGGGGGSSFVDFSGALVTAELANLTNGEAATLSVSYRILGPTATIAAGGGGGDITVSFDAPVSGFGAQDLQVTLPGGQSVGLGTLTGVTVIGDSPGTSFTVRGVVAALRAAGYSLTGTHTITIADTGAPIETADTARLRGNASFSWDVPTVSIVGAPTTPAFTPADDVRIVPSAEISGLGVEDLRLLRDDVVVPLDGVSVDFVITFTGTYYRVNGLGALTAAPGEYTLTVDATGLTDTLGNPLLGAQRVIWQNRRLLATLDVPTAPQTTGIDTVPVLFTRAVSGLDAGDFALVRRGVSSDVCGDGFCPAGAEVAISGTVTGADTNWQLSGLAEETAGEGIYTLTLNDNLAPAPLRGIADGVNVEVPVSASFVVDFDAPTATITRSADPPVGADDIVSVRFSEPVNGFDISDVTLTRNGTPVDLTDIVGFNPIRELNILNTTGVLTPEGTYVLTVAPGGITDQRAGRAFAGATSTWTVNRAPSGSFGTLSPTDTAAAGRTTPVSSVPVTFTEEVVGFDATDLSLTRDGQPVPLTGVTVSGSGTTYTVSGLGSATVLPGAYVLSIAAGSGIRDLSFTDLSGTPSVSWTMQNITPTLRPQNSLAVAEGNPPAGGTLSFPITLDRPATADVTVSWGTTTGGTATAGTDFRTTTGTARIPAGATGTTVTVPVIADTLDEPDETVQIRVTGVTGGAVLGSTATATGTITDDDPTPTLSVGDVRTLEGRNGRRTVQVPVTIATPGTNRVTIVWSTRNGTATAGSDYRRRTAETLTIPAGATSATLSVQIEGDRTREPDETFEVVIGQVRGGAIADGTGIVTIVNDD